MTIYLPINIPVIQTIKNNNNPLNEEETQRPFSVKSVLTLLTMCSNIYRVNFWEIISYCFN